MQQVLSCLVHATASRFGKLTRLLYEDAPFGEAAGPMRTSLTWVFATHHAKKPPKSHGLRHLWRTEAKTICQNGHLLL